MGYHNKYLLGSLESNIITVRALAKTKNFRGGAAGGQGWGHGGQLPPPAGIAYDAMHISNIYLGY